MYSVMSYGHMAADGVRMDAYARAIARAVKPGSVVIDLGAGTGVLSLLAARAGARKVHAVDINPCVHFVRDLARENGFAAQIEVHDVSSFELTLEEKADVIVSDLRGSTPLNDEHLALIRDARARLLRPGGVLIPTQDRLMVGVVESLDLTRQTEQALVGFKRLGLSARATQAAMANTVFVDGGNSSALSASDVLSTTERWATLDYASVEPGVFEGTVDLTIQRSGHANALAVWFQTTVHEDLAYSTAPGHGSVYSRTVLPLREAVVASAGERFEVTIRANDRGQRWAWDTKVIGRDGVVRANLRQATFLGTPTSPEALLRATTTYTPSRSPLGDRVARALAVMDGAHSVAQIADLIASQSELPHDVVLTEVRDAVKRFGR